MVAISTPVFEQVEKFRVGQIHGRPTRSKICVGHGPHGPHGSGAYADPTTPKTETQLQFELMRMQLEQLEREMQMQLEQSDREHAREMQLQRELRDGDW